MKIDTLDKLNAFIKENAAKNKIYPWGLDVSVESDGKLFVDIDSQYISVEFIVFLGNCLKKYQVGMLFSDATVDIST